MIVLILFSSQSWKTFSKARIPLMRCSWCVEEVETTEFCWLFETVLPGLTRYLDESLRTPTVPSAFFFAE
jgi:hypothetical protein